MGNGRHRCVDRADDDRRRRGRARGRRRRQVLAPARGAVGRFATGGEAVRPRVLVMKWMWAMLAIIGGLVWLQHLGTGVLAGPSWSIDGVRSWLDHTDSTVVTFVVVRA